MLSTETFEKTVYDMQERVKRYRQIEKSPELAEYNDLKKRVESSDFKERKHELVSRKYKDTDEGRKTANYERLIANRDIRRYKEALNDPVFQDFLKFRETPDFQKVHSAEERRANDLLKKYYDLYNSSYYKNYMKVLNSSELRQLTALEEEVNTEDFKRRNALWEDAKRWEHSDEYRIEQRFKELEKSDDIKFYFTQRQEKIDWAELFRPAFDDDMSSSKNWKPGFGYANPAMRDGHSRTSERQAYNGGKNTFFAEGRMDIETRAESKKAIAWDEKKGFTEHVFEYTSDVMNTKEAFGQEGGLFMAKVRTQGIGHHFFGLTTGNQKNPMVALYHYNGKRHQMGYVDGDKTQMVSLSGVLRSMYHVYSLRWTKHELIWYVNNLEILRLPNRLPKEKMFLLAQSWLPKAEKGGEGKLKVQWARIYRPVDDSPLAQRNAKASE
ncbi:MAG: family 16 glycosylhydrolase [Paludibacteraceae bacterium]|nr:family 16 glycosylhydrolase [Paludibacteraceae bacterium]